MKLGHACIPGLKQLTRAKYTKMPVRQLHTVHRARALHLFDRLRNQEVRPNLMRDFEKLQRFHRYHQKIEIQQ